MKTFTYFLVFMMQIYYVLVSTSYFFMFSLVGLYQHYINLENVNIIGQIQDIWVWLCVTKTQ